MFDLFFRPFWPHPWSRQQNSLLDSDVEGTRAAVPARLIAQDPTAQPSEPGLLKAGREFRIGPVTIPGLAGFRIDSEDVPGFNVQPPDNVLGFRPDEDHVNEQDTTWSLETLDPALDTDDESRAPELPQVPTRLYAAAFPPPQLASPDGGQISGQRPMPAIISSRAPAITDQRMSSRPATAEVPLRPWHAMYGGLPAQIVRRPSPLIVRSLWKPASEPSALPARPLAVVNAVRETTGDLGVRSKPKPFSPLHHAPTQQPAWSVPLGSSRTVTPLAGSPRATHGAQQESSPLTEATRQFREADARRGLTSIRTPPSPSSIAADRHPPYASVPAGQSWARNLAQSSVDTIVPGAHYQKLAQQQLDAGNYLGAGVYQVAAFLDAALGTATLGLSTRATAAARVAAREGANLFRRVFESRSQLMGYLGKAPEGMQWHHIVEQSQAVQFGQQRIQSVENIVAIPIDLHARLSAFYSSKQRFSEPTTVREWLRKQSFESQYEYGMRQLRRILGY